MSAEVRVACQAAGEGWSCTVAVEEQGSQTRHEVSVSRAELQLLDTDAASVEPVVEESFRFLLEREPKESILRRFTITDIGRYFPEYQNEIGRRLRTPS